MPIAKEWRTIISGDKVEGTVISHQRFDIGGNLDDNGQVIKSKIEFTWSDQRYYVYGPENTKYKIGRKLPVLLNKEKPEKFIIANFSGFYIHKRSVSLIIVFIFWIAIYSTIVQYQKGNMVKKK